MFVIPALSHRRCEAGHGEFSHESLLAADRAMAEVFEGGRKARTWRVSSGSAFALLAAIISMYDRQLHSATLGALITASDRLDRFKGGEAYQPLQTCPRADEKKARQMPGFVLQGMPDLAGF